MENLIKIDTVDQYNKMFGLETLHPLVSVVDLSKSETWPTNFRVNYGSPDKPGGLSIQLCKSEKKEFYIRYSS